ncbi:metallophosphoesterase family protein [Changchengzhania lutea]|uniref:metallophosphoesterase family protein n=1 Tax=Changchengzhania lutea TaxID=2049305 RepID=UPI00115E3461|nr:metallophosphoesterase [Changchengzhania lutea]
MNNEIVSILHLSDLHRSRANPLNNAALLSSLIIDIDRIKGETPSIKKPDIIIVSGDIIRGSHHIDADASNDEINEQYNEAFEFLNSITNKLLDGDKSRIIIIPGNHDVSWSISKESMEKVETANVLNETGNVKSSVLEDSINTHSNIKWNWDDLSFYEVTDIELYANRLKAFCDFYSRFYEGNRSYSLRPNEQFDIFDIPKFNIAIVGFNSCYNNDHLNKAGAIHPECIGNAIMNSRKYKKQNRKLIAVWHHNTKGTPYCNDYMENSFIKNLIDSNFILGFHGHQHKTEIIREEKNIIEEKKMLIFSTGTLCAGEWELPVGQSRQYNFVTIEELDKELNVVIHNRLQTAASSLELPVWTKGNIDNTNNSYFEYKINYQKVGASLDQKLAEIDTLVLENNYENALILLTKLDTSDVFVRKYTLKCLVELEDSTGILKYFSNPINEEESIHVLNAAFELKDRVTIGKLLVQPIIENSTDPSVIITKNKAKSLI